MLTIHQYNTQRAGARNRRDRHGNPIQFLLTYEEWLTIWLESGHAHERGRGAGRYYMSRYDDTGNYEVGNVFIQLFVNNLVEAHVGRKNGPHSEERRRKISAALKGKKCRLGKKNRPVHD